MGKSLIGKTDYQGYNYKIYPILSYKISHEKFFSEFPEIKVVSYDEIYTCYYNTTKLCNSIYPICPFLFSVMLVFATSCVDVCVSFSTFIL